MNPEKPASRRWSLPREGRYWFLAALGLGFTGWFKSINLILLLAYLMVGLGLLNFVIVRLDLRNLRGRRLPPGAVFARIPFVHEIALTGERRGPSRTGWVVRDDGPDHRASWFVTWWNGQPLRLRETITLPRRGRYRLEPLQGRSRYPFGLVEYQVELAPAEEWLILPALGQIDGEQLRQWVTHSARGDGRRHSLIRQASMQEADIRNLRAYRYGDSPRWIHWRSTARRGELMVREFENQPSPDLLLIVDPCLADVTNLDALMSLAATICQEWNREANLRFGLIITGPEPQVLMGRTRSEFTLELYRALALEAGGIKRPGLESIANALNQWATSAVLCLTIDGRSPWPKWIEANRGRPVAWVTMDAVPDWYTAPE